MLAVAVDYRNDPFDLDIDLVVRIIQEGADVQMSLSGPGNTTACSGATHSYLASCYYTDDCLTGHPCAS